MQQLIDQPVKLTARAVSFLNCDAFERPALFSVLQQERGRRIPYRTFYDWCQLLAIDPGAFLYTAEEALLLLTLCWAYRQRARNLDYEQVCTLTEKYIQCKEERSSTN